MKLVAFGASNSKRSINKRLAAYAAAMVEGAEVEVLDLNDYELPLFGEDIEAEFGQPQAAKTFLEMLGSADAIVVSLAEHNGSYTAAYKNLFDWVSRVDREVFQQKPVIYLSTSPGPGGGASVLASAIGSAGFFGADVKGSLSIPSFYENFDLEAGVLRSATLQQQLVQTMDTLISA